VVTYNDEKLGRLERGRPDNFSAYLESEQKTSTVYKAM